MLYLSQLLGKKIYYQGHPFGKIIDMAIFLNRATPPVSKIEILQGKTKITIPPQSVRFEEGKIILTNNDIPHLPYDHSDLYLAEDLLDKQVIDVDGRRLVRVNDVVLENGHELKVAGIDVGFDGVLRRLGIDMHVPNQKILPWNFIEAFDYDTGNIKLKLKQNSLSKLHPADIADILEDAGTKERVGIVESLDAKQAARAIEEADEETQLSILENLTPEVLKNVINKMHISELADVFHDLNPVKSQQIQQALSGDRLQRVNQLSRFSDKTAGGLMHERFLQLDKEVSVKELLEMLKESTYIPEVILITNGGGKYIGLVQVKDLLTKEKTTRLENCITERKFIHTDASYEDMLRLFAQYNLRVLPVLDKDKLPIGIVLVDEVLKIIEEEGERHESI